MTPHAQQRGGRFALTRAPRQCVQRSGRGTLTCQIREVPRRALRLEPTPMPKIEVKRVQASMTISDMEPPHWVAVVDYGAFEVEIPLPARYLMDDDVGFQSQPARQRSRACYSLDSAYTCSIPAIICAAIECARAASAPGRALDSA